MAKLTKAFGVNPDKVRIREFEFEGQKFRVRVPLVKEAETLYKKAENPPQEQVDAKYELLSKEFIDKKQELTGDDSPVKFTDDDIVVGETSLRDLAKSQVSGELRIIEAFKMLVPVDNTDLGDITYSDIEEEFPLPIQLALVKKITEVISPNYEESRKN